ncbi:MAG: hypothetical protein HUU14_07000 [Dehalococcoidia bacterium]|nr:MAG: hypothetical protein EDM76_00760 [bacterium]MCE7927346.1 hypothetical protein [Chloroflexi bacterium CFX7]MCL4230504.1 hypothetical protein [Dehalococcoidia bacterium]NUQ55613.1 hypothetical protein [Dehalococcoidia bacterium]
MSAEGDSGAPRGPGEEPGFAVLDWARAVALGIQDTLREMLDEGRRGAREAYDERWKRFDAKARKRRGRD